MPVTIKVNGVVNSLVHKGSNGVSVATIPDVCKTPSPGGPVPIPYPNVSQSATLAKGTTTVKADGGMMIANKGSEFSLSNGDNPGVAGGVKSSTFMKESTWITYSFDVKMEGKGAARLTDKKFQNHENTVDMGGELQVALGAFIEKMCPLICDVVERIKRGESPPKGKSTWTQHLRSEFVKRYGDDLARFGVKLEKSALIAVAKGRASAWGRKAVARFGRKLGQKAVIVWVPLLGEVAAVALTAVDVVTTVADVASLAGDLAEVIRVRPDFTITAGGETLVGDIKLPGDKLSPGQREAYTAINKGEKLTILDSRTCGCK